MGFFDRFKGKKTALPEIPVEGKKFIEAGQLDRLSADWFGSLLSPNQEVRMAFPVIRARSRDLSENSPVMASFIGILQQSLKPYKLHSKVANARKGINSKVAGQIEDAWKEFTKAGNFEVSGRYSLDDALDQWIQSWATDGEVLIRRLRGMGPHGYQVQLIHTDLLAKDQTQTSNYSMGIERNSWDAPVAFLLHTTHPGEGAPGGQLLRLPPSDVIHAFKPHQIGACRGLPPAMASMRTIKLLDDYRTAELVAAKVGACIAVFYTQDGSVTSDPYNGAASGPASGVPGGPGFTAPVSSPTGQILKPGITPNRLAPGMAEALPMGVKPNFLTPSHPNTAFGEFSNSLKLEIAAGIGLSYNILYSDWQNTSFSSMKAAYNQDKQFVEDLQEFLISKVLDVIFEDWIDFACTNGVLDLPAVAGSFDVYKDHKFIPPAFPMPDPLKDIQAQVADFALGTTSKSRLAAARGENYEEILIERQRDRELELEYGESDVTPQPTNNPAFGKPGTPANTPVEGPAATPPPGKPKEVKD